MSLQVFSVDRKTLYEFPENRVQHILQSTLDALVLCPRFAENGRCSRRNACRRVHAFAKDAVSCSHPHVNFIYTMVGDCMYECHSQESLSRIVSDDESTKSDNVLGAKAANGECPPPPGHIRALLKPESQFYDLPIECVIKTRANIFGRRTPSICAHYFYNRRCNAGASCNFLHFVYVDPAVATNRCAFAPLCLPGQPMVHTAQDQRVFSSHDQCDVVKANPKQTVETRNVELPPRSPHTAQSAGDAAVVLPIIPLMPVVSTVIPVFEIGLPLARFSEYVPRC